MAYARKPRTVKKTFKKRSPSKRYANPSTSLTRFNFSKKRYYKNRGISTRINNFAENHLLQLFRQDEVPGIAIQLAALAHYRGFVLGSVPPGWDTNLIDLAGLSINQGTGQGQRAGDYVYLKNSTVSMEIDMNKISTGAYTPPTEFRVIVFKQRRGVLPAGINFNPAKSLYLDELGAKTGYQTPGVNGSDLMLQPLNKRDWQIHTDKQFVLSNPAPITQTTTGGYSGNYPTLKRMRFNLPYWKRTHYDNASLLPDDIDYHWGIIVFARSQGKDTAANTFEINMRGSTSFTDV